MKDNYLDSNSAELKGISIVLSEMLTYPESLQEFTFRVIPTYESLIQHYKQYQSEFPHEDPVERKFFDPNWIPIAVDLEGIYVDPDDPNLQVFGTLRSNILPFSWRKVELIDSLSMLALVSCDVEATHDLFLKFSVSCMDADWEMERERENRIYKGELPADEIKSYDVFPEDQKNKPTKIKIDELHVHIENVYPLCISILDHDPQISNVEFKWIDMPVLKEELPKLTCIRNLITHIRPFEPRLMEHLSLKVDKSNILFYYQDYHVDVFFSNVKDLERFTEQFNGLFLRDVYY
jgi:hypothetical protein